jgi:hypothetical protein
MNAEQTVSEKKIYPRWRARLVVRGLNLARVAWPLYVALVMSIFVAGLQARYLELTNPIPRLSQGLERLGLGIGAHATYNLALEIVFALVFIGVAAIIYARNSDDWIGVFSAYALVTFGMASSPILPTLDSLTTFDPAWDVAVKLLRFLAWALLLIFFYLFPDGRFLYPVMRPMVIITMITIQIPWNMFPDSPISPWQWPAWWHIAAILATWGPAILTQVLHYVRISDSVRRQQIKWFVFGSVAAFVGSLGVFIPRLFDPQLGDPGIASSLQYQIVSTGVLTISVMMLPLSIGISILRYRLWDIDLIINKTLVYIPLTSILAGMYAASLKIFQAFFENLLGLSGDISVVLTTLLLVSTFSPIKDAIQRAVDRRFKGPPSPADKLRDLNDEMQDFVDLHNSNRIARRVMENIVSAFDATGGVVYLGEGDDLKLSAAYGDWHAGDTALHVDIIFGERKFGCIELGPHKSGEHYSPEDEKTLRGMVDLLASSLNVTYRVTPELARAA